MKLKYFFLFLFLSVAFTAFSQEQEAVNATTYGTIPAPVFVPSIAQQITDGTFKGVDPDEIPRLGQPKRSGANMNVPGKGLPIDGDPLVAHQKASIKHASREPKLVFDANTSGYTPSDPTGAVGPNHYVGGWNVGFRIFDKAGNPLTPAASLSTLFPGNNLGDPIVLYDAAADRFIITEFDSSPNGFNVAISQGPDPVNDGWYVYTTGFTTSSFPDYPKFSIWSDGYYVTANISSSNRLFVIERDKVILGETAKYVAFPLTGINTSGFYSPQVFNVTNGNLPASGNASVVYLQDDAWNGVSTDHLKIWTVNVDWENTAQSTISAPQIINTEPFISVFDGGSFSNRPQPSGPQQDVLQATIMNQAQYRRFPTHNSAIFNFVVDTDGTSGELAGIRWYELRQPTDGDPWEIYQEGTYISPYNNKDAFSGSMAMDAFGNIGMGYTTVSTAESIAIYYTGRYASDPLGQMTIDETLIAQSLSNNPSNRLADYVHLTVDPSNDKTFWHIAEYFKSGRKDVVGVFQIASDFNNDVGMMSIDAPNDGVLSDEEPVTVTLFNYGIDGQKDIPVFYQLDNEEFVYEIFTDTLPPASSANYTFETKAPMGTVGQTYQLRVGTALENDEGNFNDTIVKIVTFLTSSDVGVTSVLAPVSGTDLTQDEQVIITISNFGTSTQSDFEVNYLLNDSLVTEIVTDTLHMAETLNYTFQQTADFTALGEYILSAFTSVEEDSNTSNDTTTVTIVKSNCQPGADCTLGDGLRLFRLGEILNVTDCSPNGYGDYSDLTVNLERGETYELEIATGYGDQFIKVWIDFNDNFVFEDNEVIVDNIEIANNQGAGNYSEIIIISLADSLNLGEHLLRAKTNWNAPVPQDACSETSYGETEDYKVNIGFYTDINTQLLSQSELIINTLDNNKFDVLLQSDELSETMIISLHNIMGQKLIENRVNKIDGRYYYPLDLSYAAAGVYIVRMGTHRYGKVKKIYVK
ncbi:MAG: hypothetical protein CVT92_16205 [Bacteroidetes bacterium HGW-Bacteroidetes-1]|jgi:hypothetical protein|nr:MAG: hypothetical protein CVT92_16205 [Bacteroidetes bacterium HGW-Bacteroidetes-1]